MQDTMNTYLCDIFHEQKHLYILKFLIDGELEYVDSFFYLREMMNSGQRKEDTNIRGIVGEL